MTEPIIMEMPVWSLKTAEPFKNLFPIQDRVLSEMIGGMTANGFDAGHPIVIWKMTVVDGHTRLRAAIAAGLETVPVICRRFKSEEDALEYAIRSQRNRRNLTDYELLQCLEKLDWRKKLGRPSSECCTVRGKSAEIVADTLGVSRTTVERLRVISDHGSDEVKEALRQGKYSISRAYEESMRPRRPVEKNEPDPDAEAVHSVMAEIHARMNGVQIRKLVKALQLELATN